MYAKYGTVARQEWTVIMLLGSISRKLPVAFVHYMLSKESDIRTIERPIER